MPYGILRRPGHRPPADRGELRPRSRPDRPGLRDAGRAPPTGQTGPRPPRAGLAGDRRTRIIALARRDPDAQTVTLVLDATTANIAMFAITAHARDREAHLREIERYGQTLPEGSYGRANRQTIAAHEARLAARLRAIEHAYRTAIDYDAAFTPAQRAQALSFADHVPDWEIESE